MPHGTTSLVFLATDVIACNTVPLQAKVAPSAWITIVTGVLVWYRPVLTSTCLGIAKRLLAWILIGGAGFVLTLAHAQDAAVVDCASLAVIAICPVCDLLGLADTCLRIANTDVANVGQMRAVQGLTLTQTV